MKIYCTVRHGVTRDRECFFNINYKQNRYDKLCNFYYDEIEKFYDKDLGIYHYSRVDGKLTDDVRKHPHIFSILYDLCPLDRQKSLMDNVLLNEDVYKITTPYMRFYEIASLMKLGRVNEAINEIKSYWGGMLDMGATSFWESYNPNESEPQCYAMYDRPYGKSLCHAWGAAPIYLVGRYFLGLKPTKIGYEEFEISPTLSVFSKFEAEMPINDGYISLKYENDILLVYHTKGVCKLKINNSTFTIESNQVVKIDCKKEVII